MSTRKGFAAILIPLIVLVVLAVGGGVIIYSKNKTTSLKTTGQEIRQNPTKEDEQLPAQDVFKAQPNNFAAKTVVKENIQISYGSSARRMSRGQHSSLSRYCNSRYPMHKQNHSFSKNEGS